MVKTNKKRMVRKKQSQPRRRKRNLQTDVPLNFFSIKPISINSKRLNKRPRKIQVPSNLGFLNGAVPI